MKVAERLSGDLRARTDYFANLVTTDRAVMRYIDVVMMSSEAHDEAQAGPGGEAARTRRSAAARGQEPAGGCTDLRRAAANGVPLARSDELLPHCWSPPATAH